MRHGTTRNGYTKIGDQIVAEHSVIVQEGSAWAPDRFNKNENAQAIQEIARLTVEASLAFDRGDDALGRARAKTAADKLKIVEDRLSDPAHARARSKLAEQRGRLQLEFLDDEDAARLPGHRTSHARSIARSSSGSTGFER